MRSPKSFYIFVALYATKKAGVKLCLAMHGSTGTVCASRESFNVGSMHMRVYQVPMYNQRCLPGTVCIPSCSSSTYCTCMHTIPRVPVLNSWCKYKYLYCVPIEHRVYRTYSMTYDIYLTVSRPRIKSEAPFGSRS